MTKPRSAAPRTVILSQELFATSNDGGSHLVDAMLEAARARGFTKVEESGGGVATLHGVTAATGKSGARARGDLGAHAHPIATAAARAMGVPVTMVQITGTATGSKGHLAIALVAKAMQIDRAGKVRALRIENEPDDFTQDDELDWSEEDELARAGYDHAGNALVEVCTALGLSLEGERGPKHFLRRPTGTARVEEVASLIAIASAHELVPQPDGRVLVRMTLADGKRLAYLSADEARELAGRKTS